MLKQKDVLGKFLAAAICLSGFSAISHDAVAGGWVESGRTAYYKNSFFGSFDSYTCGVGGPDFAGFPGSCPNDGASGWNSNFTASFNLSSSDLNICNFDPHSAGSSCDTQAYAINGQAVRGGLPANCTVGTRAVASWGRKETIVIQYEELDVETTEQAREYVCQ